MVAKSAIQGAACTAACGKRGMQRPHGHLDSKSGRKGDEKPDLGGGINAAGGDKIRNTEGAAIDAQPDNRQQHKNRAGHGIQEELNGRINAAGATPDADEEVHGNESEFPEDVEEEQVLCE